MCKKLISVFLTLMISVFALSACGGNRLSDSDMDIYEKIHTYYSKMESYSANVTFSCFSNKSENKYTAEQKAMGNDKFFIKVSNPDSTLSVTTIANGAKTKTLTDGTDYSVTVPTADTTNLLFVNSFFKTYYSSEETYLAVNGAGKGNVTVLETDISPKSANSAKVSLSVSNKTLAPVNLTVYDMGGKVVLSAEFSNFQYNDKSVTDTDFTTD